MCSKRCRSLCSAGCGQIAPPQGVLQVECAVIQNLNFRYHRKWIQLVKLERLESELRRLVHSAWLQVQYSERSEVRRVALATSRYFFPWRAPHVHAALGLHRRSISTRSLSTFIDIYKRYQNAPDRIKTHQFVSCRIHQIPQY